MADPYDPNAFVDRLVRNRLDDALDDHGGYVPPGVRRHPALAPDRTSPENPIAGALRGAASAIPPVPKRGDFLDHLPSLSEMAAGAWRSMANWGEGRPEVQDVLTPTGAMAFGSAPMGALAANTLRRSPDLPAKSGLTLSENLQPVLRPDRLTMPDGSPQFYYHVMQDGQKIGSATGYVTGDTAHIGWIGASGRENTLGPAGVRQLREAFRSEFPDVVNFTGGRVSGARYHSADPTQTVHMKSDPSASLPGTFVPQPREDDARNRLINALADDPLDPHRSRSRLAMNDTPVFIPRLPPDEYINDPASNDELLRRTDEYTRPYKKEPPLSAAAAHDAGITPRQEMLWHDLWSYRRAIERERGEK